MLNPKNYLTMEGAWPLEGKSAVLTLYFAKIGDAEKTDITFTENTLGNGSTMAFVIKDQIVELNAVTTDGSITFEAILRYVVGLIDIFPAQQP